jgi:lipopolysaccharide export system protein LptC
MQFRRSGIDRAAAWAPVAILAALAALTYWLDAQVQKNPPARDGGRHEPDLYIENFSAASLGPDGKVRDRITAVRGRHFSDDRSTELDQPTLVATEAGKPRLEVKADRAMVSGDREDVFFYGNVRATRDEDTKADKDQPVRGPVTLTTDYLYVMPRAQRLSTDRPVTINEPRAIIRGTGLEYDHDARTLSITSPSGEFLPQKK